MKAMMTYDSVGEIVLAAVEGNGLLVTKIKFVHGVADVLNDGEHDVFDVVGLVQVALPRCSVSALLSKCYIPTRLTFRVTAVLGS